MTGSTGAYNHQSNSMNLLLIAIGGAFGSVLRYLTSTFVSKQLGSNFPFSTLSVNLIGAFLVGLIIEFTALKFSASENLRYFLITGFLGGFTTFSAFSLESALMWNRSDYLSLAIYIFASVIGTISMVLAAMQFSKILI
jgi:CrcB protein